MSILTAADGGMSSEFTGHVTAIAQETRGATLVVEAADGATTLTVDDVADFAEEGGILQLAADGATPATQLLTYTSVDDDTSTITLATAVSSGWPGPIPAGASVACWDPGDQVPVVEWIATVVDDLDGSQLEAAVAHALIPLLQAAVRSGTEESVVCTRGTDGQWTVTDVLGKTPVLDSPHGERSRAAAATIPAATDTVLTYDTFPALRGGMQVSSGVWVIPSTGRYLLTANVGWDADATASGHRRVWATRNGVVWGESRVGAAGTNPTWQSLALCTVLAEGDQLQMSVSQNNSANAALNIVGAGVTVTCLD